MGRSIFGVRVADGATLMVLRKRKYLVSKPTSDGTLAAPPPDAWGARRHQGVTMKIIAKVIESMLSKDATQKWNGQTSALESSNTWHWNP
jgi:hypothetical protein